MSASRRSRTASRRRVRNGVIVSGSLTHVIILDAGRAAIEFANPAQVAMIDRVETEGRPSTRLRVAFEVDDAADGTRRLVDAGAELVAEPRETPWRSELATVGTGGPRGDPVPGVGER